MNRESALSAISLSEILPGIDGLLFLVGADERIIDFRTGQAGELFVAPAAFLGKPLGEVLPPDAAAVLREGLRTMQPGKASLVEYALPYPDGLRHFEAQLMPLAGNRCLAVVTHVTRRVQAEEGLRKSEARFRALIEEGLDLVMTLDRDGRITFASPAARSALGYSDEELLGTPLIGLIHPDDIPRIGPLFAGVLSGERPVARSTARLRHKSGAWRVVDGVMRNLLGNPSVQAVVANARDITEQRQLEGRLLQADRLESVGRLAGGIAHDFNNILTAILGYAEILQAEVKAGRPVHAEDLGEIQSAGRRARDLTAQLLAFARRQVISPRAVDLNEVIRNSERMLRRLLGEPVELTTSLTEGLWPIHVDRSQIEQVILNLAVNARDAMPAGGHVLVETSNVVLTPEDTATHTDLEPGPHTLLVVTDTGGGIAADTLPHIFEPFFTTKVAGEGTGLGLATVYGIVRQSGGSIWVYSEPGHGTTFKLYFPRLQEEVSSPLTAPEEGRAPSSGTETILVVEDDATVRGLTSRALREAGYDVLVAETPQQALELARATPGHIALLVSDVVMPRMSGKALADALRAERPSMRVLYVSGYTENTIVHHGVLEPGVQFLAKPFSPSRLRERVREAIDA